MAFRATARYIGCNWFVKPI